MSCVPLSVYTDTHCTVVATDEKSECVQCLNIAREMKPADSKLLYDTKLRFDEMMVQMVYTSGT